MRDKRLDGFILAGGTALALYLGHRKSIDLDLFAFTSFDAKDLQSYVFEKYDFETQDVREQNTLKGFVNDVKVEFISHIYPLLTDIVIEDGIRLYSINDIAAMKLAAIGDNGTRLKDFIDIACLSVKMPLSEMLVSYGEKYKRTNPIHALKGLSYFSDIDFKTKINMINGRFEWKLIERRIKDMIKNENKIFANLPV